MAEDDTQNLQRLTETSSSWGGNVRGAIYDISTNSYTPKVSNQEGVGTDTNDRSIDSFAPTPQAEAVSSGNPGMLIYRADGTQELLSSEDILADYDSEDDWSIEFAVSSGALVAFSTTAPSGTTATDRWTLDGSDDQDTYRIPVIRTISGTTYTYDINGIYRENTFCGGADGPLVELIRIG